LFSRPSDDVDAATLAEVLGGVVGLLAPERPQDRGHLVIPALALPDVGQDDDGALGDETLPALDLVQLDGLGKTGVSLLDANE